MYLSIFKSGKAFGSGTSCSGIQCDLILLNGSPPPPRVTVIRNYVKNAHCWLPVYQQGRSNFTVLTKHAIFTVSITLGNTTLHLPCKTTYLQQHSTSQLTWKHPHTLWTKKVVAWHMDLTCRLSVLVSGLPLTDVCVTFLAPYWLNYTKEISTCYFCFQNQPQATSEPRWRFCCDDTYLSYEGTCNINLCSNVCIYFSLTSLHFQSSILTCAARMI